METIITLKKGFNLANIVIKNDDGTVTSKNVTMKNLCDAFKEQEPKKYYLLNSLFDDYEPAGKVEGLIFGKEEEGICKGIFFIPADSRYMNISGEKSILPYPSVLFCLSTKNGILCESRCFAMKEKKIDQLRMDSRLYAFPFGNVHPSDAHICWGSNFLGHMYNYIDLRGAVSVFFSSESNQDYVKSGSSYSETYGKYHQFIGKIKERKTFPEKALVLSPQYRTLGDMIRLYEK